MNRHLSKEDIQMNKWCMKTYSKSLVITEMQINTTMRYHFIPVRKTLIKRKPKTKDKCWQEYGNVGILVQRWWECILVQSLWETVWKFLKILKIELAYDLPIHFLLYIQMNWNQDIKEVSVLWCSLQLCSLTRLWEKISVYLWMKKERNEGYIHTKDYNSSLKKKEILTYVIMRVEDSLLNEISQSKVTFCMIPLIWSI